jgi:hypothetical protein
VELVVVEEVVVVVAVVPVVPAEVPAVFPATPGASPDVLVASQPLWCLPFVAAAASEPVDLLQPVEGSMEDSSLVEVG